MDEEKKEALIRAAEVLANNANFCAKRAEERIERLRRAKTDTQAAEAGKAIFGWIEQIEQERKTADSAFMRNLGRLWEFD